jgi:hypothetical protein
MSDLESNPEPSPGQEKAPMIANGKPHQASWVARIRTIANHTPINRIQSGFLLGLIIVAVWSWSSPISHEWLHTLVDWVAPSNPLTLAQRLPWLISALGILVILLLWILPKRQAAHSQGLTAENSFDRENEARKTLSQIIGGVFLLAGLYSSLQGLHLQREGQITDRFTKAIEQLGAVNTDGRPKMEVRLGAIYALERIAHDSERDHWPIMEVLTAYVREADDLPEKTV